MKLIIFMLYFLVVIYNYLDGYYTFLLVKTGISEFNPFVLFFIETFGLFWGLFIVKTFLMLMLGILLFIYLKRKSKICI